MSIKATCVFVGYGIHDVPRQGIGQNVMSVKEMRVSVGMVIDHPQNDGHF